MHELLSCLLYLLTPKILSSCKNVPMFTHLKNVCHHLNPHKFSHFYLGMHYRDMLN